VVTENTPLHNFYIWQDLARTSDMSHFASYPLVAGSWVRFASFKDSTVMAYLQRRLQIVLITLGKIFYRPGFLCCLHSRTCFLQMSYILWVCRFASTVVKLRCHSRQNDRRPMLSICVVRCHKWVREIHTVMISLMKDCVPLGSTGYPFVLAIKVDDGRKMNRTDSAFHLLRIPKVVGKGGVRSRAND
jgi:hypothetical protein